MSVCLSVQVSVELKKQQDAWSKRMEAEKESKAAGRSRVVPDVSCLAMEERQAQLDVKRAAKLEEQQRRAAAEKTQADEEKRRKLEKLLSGAAPVFRQTKACEDRTKRCVAHWLLIDSLAG